ncbi:MAG: YihY/virulence factor BrkB family protein [Flavobacteriales bacterium]|nr:YihY/virulence factor BrkB family protein [Flavobacteriales bacterium]MCX7649657.1 YihY/virulence factor BrkB family protein [Flavobacteriales bacterium]MDW8432162.1 YihY/virulence factor BrkB family protein [Flavobacteriales bacterium]
MATKWRRIGRILLTLPPLAKVHKFLKSHSLPGFEGLSMWEVARILISGLLKSSITDRAAVMTFKLTMALFPALLFFTALVPFVPIPKLEALVLKSFGNVMPGQFSLLLQEALVSLVKNQSTSLLSFSLLAALFFGSNSLLSLMEAMNKSAFIRETRPRWKQRILALALLILIFLMTLLAVSLTYGTSEFLRFLRRRHILGFSSIKAIIYGIQLILLYVQLFATISLIYLTAPARRVTRRFFSPGAVVASNVCFLASLALSYFFNNFGSYNKIYGTIGSIPVVLLWIYVNCLVLLVGFELNASIKVGKMDARNVTLKPPPPKNAIIK